MTRSAYYWIYMLECKNGSYYTGYTTNLVRRFRQHVDGTAGVRYTRIYTPVRIAQCWRLYDSVGYALKVERLIKAAGRKVKNQLVHAPTDLKQITAIKLGRDLAIFTFDPRRVEKASQKIDPKSVLTAPDPFASAPPTDL